MIILRIMILFIPSLCLKEKDESNNIFLEISISDESQASGHLTID